METPLSLEWLDYMDSSRYLFHCSLSSASLRSRRDARCFRDNSQQSSSFRFVLLHMNCDVTGFERLFDFLLSSTSSSPSSLQSESQQPESISTSNMDPKKGSKVNSKGFAPAKRKADSHASATSEPKKVKKEEPVSVALHVREYIDCPSDKDKTEWNAEADNDL